MKAGSIGRVLWLWRRTKDALRRIRGGGVAHHAYTWRSAPDTRGEGASVVPSVSMPNVSLLQSVPEC